MAKIECVALDAIRDNWTKNPNDCAKNNFAPAAKVRIDLF
jgi:hypothetical protein